ncbi:MAG: LemA family protein [Podoviridae sp. ctcf755]|nr:MAG: LemA family protein [Podoviridae sp. ctcf755]
MLIVLFSLFFILLIMSIVLYFKDNDEKFIGGIVIFGFILFGIIGATAFCIDIVIHEKIYQQQIEILEEENTTINKEIKLIVKEYMNWESDVYDQFKNESAITLIQLYPELKSNELVQTQIDIFLSNREEIKCLKKNILESKAAKWWLYFGG